MLLTERIPGIQRRTVRVLVGSQIFGGIGVALGFAVGSLLAEDISGSASLAGFAQTSMVLGSALASAPLARLMALRGRRPGLLLGYALGAAGALVVIVAAATLSYPLLLAGLLLFGCATTSNLQARYAATDLASDRTRGRALATVVWATTVGAVAGPNLAAPAGDLATRIGLHALAGPFLFAGLAFLAGGCVLLALLRPDPLLVGREDRDGTPLRRRSLAGSFATVLASPPALLGLSAAAVGHATMVGVMVMTPVHMHHDGAALTVVGLVISVHVAGMYALSPVVGWCSDRLGRVPVILLGQGVLLAAVLLAGTAAPGDAARLGVGLFLLGLGWSCSLVAGSTLLTESVPQDARPGAQGVSDLVMGICGAAGGAVAGVVVGVASYGLLNAMAAVIVIPLAGFAFVVLRRGAGLAGTSPE
ncbi:MAG: MFS transporter [Streptomycetales bacterium]